MRLGLLSPKKQCAILNSFVDTDGIERAWLLEGEAFSMARYYKKHQQSYTRWQLRQQLIDNKKARKRELIAKNTGAPMESIDPNSIEVSDVSDSELRGAETTDADRDGGYSSAEDLKEMFTDRRMDEDERYFVNKASTQLSLNDFVPTTELLCKEDLGNELDYYDAFDPNLKLDIEFHDEPSLEFNDQLKIYMFPRNSWSRFENPTADSRDGLMTHYLLDGASVLPVLALDLQFDDVCADYCAAPGGKSLAMLMTLRPRYLLSNDVSSSRLARTYNIMRQYAPEVSYVKSTLRLSNHDSTCFVQPDAFDKILIDVPCSNDRVSADNMMNNIFKRARSEERLMLPQKQCDILKSALRSVRPKGCVVYSTCTMSPLENDSVVQRALMQLEEEEHRSKFAIINLKEAFRPLRGLYRFHTKFTYGQLVVPHICSNFGPMYISKIKRLS